MKPMETENPRSICPFCAVDVRDGAVFCFNCGKSLAVVEAESSTVAVDRSAEGTGVPRISLSETPTESDAEPRPKSRTVSVAPRKRPRPTPKRDSSTTWVKPAEGPGAPFVLGAAGIGVVSLLILMIALYLR